MPKHAAKRPTGDASDSRDREDVLFDSNRLLEDDAAGLDRGLVVAADDDGDERIGLTEAFAPVDADSRKGDRADGDDPIGLTEAFAPVGEGAHAGGFSYRGDNEDSYPDALESLEPPNLPPILAADDSVERDLEREVVEGRHGKEDAIPVYLHKSRRLRRILIGVIIVLIVLLVAALVGIGMLVVNESRSAVQMATNNQQQAADDLKDGVEDASTGTEKLITAPNLAAILGASQDDAIASVGRGATVTATREVNEEGNPIKTSLTVALTEEPADARSGTPTVYLGLDEEGKVVQAGYSAPLASLGFGSLSFADAVSNEHVVEKTLQEAGIPVEEGAAVLPEDKAAYSSYDSAGTTLVRENCTFEGEATIGDAVRSWSSTLSYDYTTANASDNLANTIRLIYVYVNA